MVKEQSARNGRPCANTARRTKSSAFATWDMMRPCLQQLLGSIGQPMPLSNVKRLFRAQFHVELSETALGYAKLSECLQDPRVRDLCDVKLQGQGYTIVPARKPVQRNLISLAESLCMETEESAPLPDVETVDGSSLLHKRRGSIPQLSMEAIHSPPSSPRQTAHEPASMWSPTSVRASCYPPICITPVQTPFPPTPSPNAASARSLPRLLGRKPVQQRLALGTKDTCGSMGGWQPPLSEQKQGCAYPCKDVCGVLGEASRKAQAGGFDPLTPSTLSTMGFSVQNTFLHAPMPPPTPVRTNTRFRARSLPRQQF